MLLASFDRAPAVLNNTLFLTLALNEKYLLYFCIAEQQQGEGCGLDFFQSVKGFLDTVKRSRKILGHGQVVKVQGS